MASASANEKSVINPREYIQVLYNTCYGGFRLSEEASKLYHQRKKMHDSTYEEVWYREIPRHDPELIKIYYELGCYFNSSFSAIEVKQIERKYENFYEIKEYDGLESVYINEQAYKLDVIEKILKNGMTNDEKISELNKLF